LFIKIGIKSVWFRFFFGYHIIFIKIERF